MTSYLSRVVHVQHSPLEIFGQGIGGLAAPLRVALKVRCIHLLQRALRLIGRVSVKLDEIKQGAHLSVAQVV